MFLKSSRFIGFSGNGTSCLHLNVAKEFSMNGQVSRERFKAETFGQVDRVMRSIPFQTSLLVNLKLTVKILRKTSLLKL